MQQRSTPHWQQALAEGFNDLQQLCQYLALDPATLKILCPSHPSGCSGCTSPEHLSFPLRVPRSYAANMEKGNPHDPLLRQVLPVSAELVDYPGFSDDPVGDLAAHTASGIIHKYHGRALIIATGSCAINCRYCFRRNFPYADVQLTKSRFDAALAYIRQHTELTEIILSGGDPLLLSDDRLDDLVSAIGNITHIKRLRIHSRIPIVLPERITPELLMILNNTRLQIVLVVHANHANELSAAVAIACRQLSAINVTLLNQSVLLKGINDSATILGALSEKLFTLGILPYYLHLLDRAKGTGHFEVSVATALNLYQQLQVLLPGYLVPKLVSEQAGAAYKIPLSTSDISFD